MARRLNARVDRFLLNHERLKRMHLQGKRSFRIRAWQQQSASSFFTLARVGVTTTGFVVIEPNMATMT